MMRSSVFPSVSVVIVGYNSRRWLEPCLESVLEQRFPGEWEIVFVDNASVDGSAADVRWKFPSVRVVESAENLGYAGGSNLGASVASGSILVFLNPDTEVRSGWLAELIRPLVDDHEIGLTTSAVLVSGGGGRINACGCDISLAGITTCRWIDEPASRVERDEVVNAVSGASFAIRRALFKRLGGFDDAFWMYLEDADLSWRARLLGYRCVVASRSRVEHDYQFTLDPGKLRQIEANRYRMMLKNLTALGGLCQLPVLLATEFLAWGWAATRGPAYLVAKARAALDAFRDVLSIVCERRAVQSMRRATDAEILRERRSAPAIRRIEPGWLGRLVTAATAPVMEVAGYTGLAILDRAGPAHGDTVIARDTERQARPEFGAD